MDDKNLSRSLTAFTDWLRHQLSAAFWTAAPPATVVSFNRSRRTRLAWRRFICTGRW